jgi:hypothetical protein
MENKVEEEIFDNDFNLEFQSTKISNHQYAIGTRRLNKMLEILESNKEE